MALLRERGPSLGRLGEARGGPGVFYAIWVKVPWVGSFCHIRRAAHIWCVYVVYVCCNAVDMFQRAAKALLSRERHRRDAWLRFPAGAGPGLRPSSPTLDRPLNTATVSGASPTNMRG